ncbi:MAG: hypothetical protein JWO44_2812 [Bacteroidetes bacterium]|nr:hypothetical protein [Bacteroidota bacterium]
MKYFRIVFPLLQLVPVSFLLQFCSPAPQNKAINAALIVATDPVRASGLLYDSLTRNGVDTILTLRAYTDSMFRISAEPQLARELTVEPPAPLPEIIEPVYTFWISKGHYFLKKIDQLGVYKTIERKRRTAFPVYDYYFRNKKIIDDGQSLTDLMDDTLKRKISEDRLTLFELVKIDPAIETGNVTVSIHVQGIKKEYPFAAYYFMPIASEWDMGNSDITYYYRFITKAAEWKRIIESELFETEFRHLWQKEK